MLLTGVTAAAETYISSLSGISNGPETWSFFRKLLQAVLPSSSLLHSRVRVHSTPCCTPILSILSRMLHMCGSPLFCFNLLHVSLSEFNNVLLISIEVLGHFFEWSVPRLDQLRVNEPALEGQEAAVDDIIAPCNGVDCQRVDELIEEQSAKNCERGDCATFRAETVG